MTLFESILIGLGLLPPQGLAESMSQSRTLTLLVILQVILFGGFCLFLFKMAGG